MQSAPGFNKFPSGSAVASSLPIIYGDPREVRSLTSVLTPTKTRRPFICCQCCWYLRSRLLTSIGSDHFVKLDSSRSMYIEECCYYSGPLFGGNRSQGSMILSSCSKCAPLFFFVYWFTSLYSTCSSSLLHFAADARNENPHAAAGEKKERERRASSKGHLIPKAECIVIWRRARGTEDIYTRPSRQRMNICHPIY